jgi:hypothetical protein
MSLRYLQQGVVVAGVAHQHGAQQTLAGLRSAPASCRSLRRSSSSTFLAARGLAVGVADGAHVHAQQLELGAHVGALEGAVLAQQLGGAVRAIW